MSEDNSLNLPIEVNECHTVIKNLLVQYSQLVSERDQLVSEKNQLELKVHEFTIRNKELANRLALLTKQKYGKKTEELNAIQLKLVFEDLQNEYPDVDLTQFKEQAIESIENKKKQGSSGGRKTTQINSEIETKVVIYELEDKDLVCKTCQNQMTEIGSETSTELDYIPAKFIRIEHKRIKYSCKCCKNNVVTALKPEPLAIEKGAPSFSLLSAIITNKYADHLPLHRQEQIFDRIGANIPKSSMCRWLGVSANKLEPIYNLILEEILKSKVIQADETPLKYLKPKAGKALYGYLWTYLGDKKHNYVLYNFYTNRSGSNPVEFLKNYSGYLQTDGYAGYNKISQREDITQLCCMAHARRKFNDILSLFRVDASYALLEFGKLYEIEKRIKDLEDDEKYKIRQEEAVPILNKFKIWLNSMKTKYTKDEPFTKAVDYMLNNFEKLSLYTKDGYLSIDNNMAERNIRPIAIGRKNWLFLGNEDAGKTFSILSTLVNCCKINNINPYDYIKNILKQMTSNNDMSHEKLVELLPINFAKSKN